MCAETVPTPTEHTCTCACSSEVTFHMLMAMQDALCPEKKE